MSIPFDLPVARLLAGLKQSTDQGLAAHNSTYRPLADGVTVLSAFERAAREDSSRPAVVFDDATLTYGQLHYRATGIADQLRGIGACVGDIVAVRMDPSAARLAAVLGVLGTGAAFLPLDPELPAARASAQIADARACALLTEHAGTVQIEELVPVRAPVGVQSPVLASAAAYLMYTSGSTGSPKGVLISHRALINRLEWMRRSLDVTPADRVLHKTAFGFDVSVWEQFLPLVAGACVVLVGSDGRRDARALAGLIRDHAVTLAHFVPSMLAAFHDSGGLDRLPSLRAIVASGEPLTPSLAARVSAACAATLYNYYGPTETTIDVTAHRVDEDDARSFVPLGHPIDNTTVQVLDARLRPVAVGEKGELCIGGVSLAAGYLGRGALTARQFVPDPFGPPGTRMYRTGDLVRLHPDGVLEFLGRADSQVKIRGFRIELAEVEHVLLADPRVSHAAVVLDAHPARGTCLVAHLVAGAHADRASLESQLREFLNAKLPSYMVPTYFVVHDALPVTSAGKIDRGALPAPTPPVSADAESAPNGETERQLALVWRQAVGLSDVGRHDNFFQAGGDSITAIRVVSLARRAGFVFEVRDVFESPTIAGLARLLEQRGAAATVDPHGTPVLPRPLSCWGGQPEAAPVVLALRVTDPRSMPHLTDLVRATVTEVLPDRSTGSPVHAIEFSTAPSPVEFHAAVERWWRERVDGTAMLGATMLTAADGSAGWLVLAGEPARVDRMTLCLLAREIEARHDGGNAVIGPSVPGADLVAAAADLPGDQYSWAAAGSREAVRKTGPALHTRHACNGATVLGQPAQHVGQAALLTALGRCGFTTVDLTLAPDREWVAQTGWDVRTVLGQWSSRRHARLVLDCAGWDLVRIMKRHSRGLDPDATTDPPELIIDVDWRDLVHRPGLWREDREATTPRSGDADLRVACAFDGKDLEIEWSGSDKVGQLTLDLLAAEFGTALTALADSPEERWRGADPSDYPLSELDLEQARALARLDALDCWPLAPMQEGLLVRALFWPGSDAYHNQNVLEMRGPLAVDRLERCWRQVTERYEMLRTGFAWNELGRPVQFVGRQPSRPFNRLSWTDTRHEAVDERLESLLREDREHLFDLRQPGIYRIYLIELGDDRHLLVWSHHHILLDGWCLSLIWGDVLALYDAKTRGVRDVRPAPRRFRDYVRWLRSKEITDTDTQYWRRQVADMATGCHVSDYGPEREGPFATVRIGYSLERTRRAVALAQSCGVTLNAVLQAAWSLLLSAVTSQPDVVHGVSISGRPPELDGVETMVGLFINTVPLRVRITPDLTVAALLTGLQLQLAEAGAHGHVPLAEILAHWPARAGEAKLFDSLIAFESYPEDNLPTGPVGGVEVRDRQAMEKTEFPLGLIVLPGPALELHWNYDTAHFSSERIEDLIGIFDALVDALSVGPERLVGDLPLMSDDARHLIDGWSRGNDEPTGVASLYAGFQRSARSAPETTALVADGRSISYAELEHEAEAVARRLAARGCRPSDRVLIALRRSEGWVRAVLGVHALGAVPVLVDVEQPSAVLARIAAESASTTALVDRHSGDRMRSVVACAVDVDEAVPVDQPIDRSGAAPICCIVHTSGSTGEPKVIGTTHAGLVNRIEWTLRSYRLDGAPRLLLNAAVSFDIVLWELYYPLFAGGTVVLAAHAAALDIDAFAETVRRNRISVLHLTPTVLAELLSSDRAPACTCLQIVVTGGESVSPDIVRAFFDLGLASQLHQAYGPAEAAISVTEHACTPADALQDRVPLGRPIDNCECLVLDSSLRPVPVGVEGDLYLAGDCLAVGYLGRPGESALSFVPHPWGRAPGARMYRTGDRAMWRPGGELEFRGRRDHQVKIRGYRVDLEGVEAMLRRHPSCGAAIVQVRDAAGGTMTLEALVEGSAGERPDPDALRAWLASQLPAPMVPASVRVLPELPRTSTGKVDRRAALTLSPLPRAPRPPPRALTDLELLVARCWARELGRDVIGPHDDVFEMGATSLSVMRVFARLKKQLPAPATIEIAHLFKGPTPARLAELVHAPIAGSGSSSVLPLVAGQSATPVFLVHPVQGVSTAYFAVRDQLADLEVYAFNDPRLGGEEPFTCVEEMAAVYVEWVRSFARLRPPIIGGWSFGGLVALEMARQIQAKGGIVRAVLLIDTHRGSAGEDPDAQPGGGEPPTAGSTGTGDLLRAETARNQAMAQARAEAPYDGPVVLLRAQPAEGPSTGQTDGRCGWDPRLLPALQVIEVAGTHHDLFSERYAASTAAAIRAAVAPHLD